jgi:hypothetical protein
MDVVDFAWQVIAMDRELRDLRAENFRLHKIEQEHTELRASSLQHSQQMAGNMLKILLTPGVTNSLIESAITQEVSNEQ